MNSYSLKMLFTHPLFLVSESAYLCILRVTIIKGERGERKGEDEGERERGREEEVKTEVEIRSRFVCLYEHISSSMICW